MLYKYVSKVISSEKYTVVYDRNMTNTGDSDTKNARC